LDAIQFLKEEHGKAKAAFAKIEGASGYHRASLWNELKPELEVHERIEEACLYGPLSHDAQHRDATLAQWNQRHAEDVKHVEAVLKEIDALNAQDSRWLTKVREVRERLEGHIREEESDIFPRIALVWNRDRIERAGTELERMKAKESRWAA
jgi:hemerythrin-like domain-containing protein